MSPDDRSHELAQTGGRGSSGSAVDDAASWDKPGVPAQPRDGDFLGHLHDDVAELDAIAWNLPRHTHEHNGASSNS